MERRLSEHDDGLNSKCYTFKRRPLKLVFEKEFGNVLQAISFEKRLKGWSKAKKDALIKNEFERLQVLSECRNATHFKFKPD